jgi:hypothetical protein
MLNKLLGPVDMMLSKHQDRFLNETKDALFDLFLRANNTIKENAHEIIQAADQVLKKNISNSLLHMRKMQLVL